MCAAEKREQREQTSKDESVSSTLRFWSKVYNTIPKLYIPKTSFSTGVTITSFLTLLALRSAVETFYQTKYNWDPTDKRTVDCSASTVSGLHALVLCLGLYKALRAVPYDILSTMDSAPVYWQHASTALLEMCTGYMLYDFFTLVRGNDWSVHPDDVAFLAHHVVTILYMSQCRVLRKGHLSAMFLMFTGELTNPLMSSHSITKFGIQMEESGSIFHIIHPYVEFMYSVLYFFVRGFVGPAQVIHIAYVLLLTKRGREAFPLYIGFPWSVMIWGIILGSIPWTKEAYEMMMDGLEVKYHDNWDYGIRYEL